MSSLLKEAIVDAAALRTAALKNAEASVIDKYSNEVRNTLNKLLEQDEFDLGADLGADLGGDLGGDPAAAMDAPTPGEGDESLDEDTEDVPYAATDDINKMNGKNLKKVPSEGEPVEVTLDLGALRESIKQMQTESDEEITFDHDELIELLREKDALRTEGNDEEDDDTDAEDMAGAADDEAADITANDDAENTLDENEEIELTDEMLEDIAERLTVDMSASLSGWAGRSSESVKYELARALAQRRTSGVQDELDIMKKAQEELVFENKQLKSKLSQFEKVTGELKETLQAVNLSNARLLYTNRVLRNTSLNERQRTKIVEAISKADSVTEARTIHNMLQNTVSSAPQRKPKTLNETISRPSSVIRATRKESAHEVDPFAERMRQLAGIK